MKSIHKKIIILVVLIILISSGLYLSMESKLFSKTNKKYNTTELTDKLSINMNNWKYDAKNDLYYQIGLVYCTNPETTKYESLAIYVPGKYFDATPNENGTYTCTVNKDNQVGNFTAKNAPWIMPIRTPSYRECEAPRGYNSTLMKRFTSNGMIYILSGCRGKENGESYNGGAPWGVTDLKAAIRYIRFNNESLPGNTENIFTYGGSGGAGQSAILGTSGDSELYTPYLESIGAAMVDKNKNTISDSIAGSMCWCPITSFDTADQSYEWNLGQYSNSGTRHEDKWTSLLSDDLAREYATYINNLKLKDSTGKELTLEESDYGIYNSGSYYEYIKSAIEESLNNFLNDTEFPYTSYPESTNKSTTYNSAQEYVDSLNKKIKWVNYDANTNTAKVDNIEGFVKTCKKPYKVVGAFDDLNRNQSQNDLFGNNKSDSLHFNPVMAKLLKENDKKYSSKNDYNSSYASEYENDLTSTDAMNNTIQTRIDMYNPLYYICDYYNGTGTSKVAKYWRINSGITQGNTALCTEINLALALNQTEGVKSVEFEIVWEQGHVSPERTGNSTENYINWINRCLN